MTPPSANRNRRHGRITCYIAIVRTSWVKKLDRRWQDRLAPKRCGFRLNAAAAAPRSWDAVQASLAQQAQEIMTIWISLTGVCRNNAD